MIEWSTLVINIHIKFLDNGTLGILELIRMHYILLDMHNIVTIVG